MNLLSQIAIWSLTVQAFASVSGHRFSDPRLGFSIEKPPSWEFAKDPKSYGLELRNSGMTSAQTGIIVSFSQPMKNVFGIKPSVGVTALSVPSKMSLVTWLEQEIERQRAHDKYFAPVSPPVLTTIQSQNDAARAAFVNSTNIDGRQVRVYHAVYVVRFRDKVFLVNMNCNEDLAAGAAGDFSEIAGSIRLTAPKSIKPKTKTN